MADLYPKLMLHLEALESVASLLPALHFLQSRIQSSIDYTRALESKFSDEMSTSPRRPEDPESSTEPPGEDQDDKVYFNPYSDCPMNEYFNHRAMLAKWERCPHCQQYNKYWKPRELTKFEPNSGVDLIDLTSFETPKIRRQVSFNLDHHSAASSVSGSPSKRSTSQGTSHTSLSTHNQLRRTAQQFPDAPLDGHGPFGVAHDALRGSIRSEPGEKRARKGGAGIQYAPAKDLMVRVEFCKKKWTTSGVKTNWISSPRSYHYKIPSTATTWNELQRDIFERALVHMRKRSEELGWMPEDYRLLGDWHVANRSPTHTHKLVSYVPDLDTDELEKLQEVEEIFKMLKISSEEKDKMTFCLWYLWSREPDAIAVEDEDEEKQVLQAQVGDLEQTVKVLKGKLKAMAESKTTLESVVSNLQKEGQEKKKARRLSEQATTPNQSPEKKRAKLAHHLKTPSRKGTPNTPVQSAASKNKPAQPAMTPNPDRPQTRSLTGLGNANPVEPPVVDDAEELEDLENLFEPAREQPQDEDL